MRRAYSLPIIGAVITALLSTACCLPAFLFLFFGVSSGALGFLTQIEFLRVPLTLASIVFFLIGFYKLNKKLQCSCDKKTKTISYVLVALGFIALFFILFYPEILPLFMES